MPEGDVQSMTCSLKQSFSELRNHFASEFNQPPQTILMIFDGKMVEDHTVLSELVSNLDRQFKSKFSRQIPSIHLYCTGRHHQHTHYQTKSMSKWKLVGKDGLRVGVPTSYRRVEKSHSYGGYNITD
ncbi:hypothetical protein OS493_021778 [Desmophyllum pertusum]|uniref:Ubiquitin-like domain-containing protein n=1 Tax=Desmophyllum pertusum TaxID=174260 RepID=A0A9X0D840_9CNID|nr:hypothetical protein OS493_021778 [Desmophyllum pertusum]